MQQLTIFDVIPQTKLNIGDDVMVVQADKTADAETDYYLPLFKGRKGTVVRQLPKMQYEAEFNGKRGIFYNEELRRI